MTDRHDNNESLQKYYEILEVDEGATESEIKKAFHHLTELYSSHSVATMPIEDVWDDDDKMEILLQLEEAYEKVLPYAVKDETANETTPETTETAQDEPEDELTEDEPTVETPEETPEEIPEEIPEEVTEETGVSENAEVEAEGEAVEDMETDSPFHVEAHDEFEDLDDHQELAELAELGDYKAHQAPAAHHEEAFQFEEEPQEHVIAGPEPEAEPAPALEPEPVQAPFEAYHALRADELRHEEHPIITIDFDDDDEYEDHEPDHHAADGESISSILSFSDFEETGEQDDAAPEPVAEDTTIDTEEDVKEDVKEDVEEDVAKDVEKDIEQYIRQDGEEDVQPAVEEEAAWEPMADFAETAEEDLHQEPIDISFSDHADEPSFHEISPWAPAEQAPETTEEQPIEECSSEEQGTDEQSTEAPDTVDQDTEYQNTEEHAAELQTAEQDLQPIDEAEEETTDDFSAEPEETTEDASVEDMPEPTSEPVDIRTEDTLVEAGPASGTLFARIRENRGLQIETVAQDIGIAANVLTAIEKEDFANIPDAGLLRWYVSTYAKALNIEYKEAANQYMKRYREWAQKVR